MSAFNFFGTVGALTAFVALAAGCSGPLPHDPGVELSTQSEQLCTAGGLVSNDADYRAAPGTMVTWTGSATCQQPNPEYEFWLQDLSSTWSIVQAWSATSTYAWNTTALPEGTYNWQVWVREAGSGSTYDTYSGRPFVVTSSSICGQVSSTASPPNGTSLGTTVTITSSANCGAGTPQYEIWHQPPGGAFSILSPYSSSSAYQWDTTSELPGTHALQVWVHAAGSPSQFDTFTDLSYVLASACTSVSQTFNPPSTTTVGTPVTISAVGVCGGMPEYEFWILPPGGSWTVAQAWSASANYNWDTTSAAAGSYAFQIWVRNSGSTAMYEVYSGQSYTLIASSPACAGATLNASPASPAQLGTQVAFTAGSTTCTSPTYRFWMLPPGGSWTMVQDFGSSANFNWNTTGVTTGLYTFQVWVRQSGSTVSYDTFADLEYAVSASTTARISAGAYHTCASLTDGTARCWGNNDHGELGNGTLAQSSTPGAVSGLSGISSLTSGYYHSCAALTDGTARCWGDNETGELGNGTLTSASTPVTVTGLSGVSSISGGSYHTCAVLTDHTGRCWGYNSGGQLGNQATVDSSTPVTVSGLNNIASIGAGYWHSCGLLTDGTVRCWGQNSFGQLGNGNTTNSLPPVTVSGLSNVVSMSVVDAHACVLLGDATARCWGYNANGQLGNNSTTNASSPVTVSGLSNIASITTGPFHSCAALTDGTARCWGDNTYGQLGDGTMTSSSVPVTVTGLSGVVDIKPGFYHTCAILTDGTGRCWGHNIEGELGNGTTTSSSTPVTVLNIP